MSKAIVALGNQLYKVERDWINDGSELAGLTSVAALANGSVAALFRLAPHIRIYGSDGGIIATHSISNVVCPHHITAIKDGFLITDLDGHTVIKLNNDGVEKWRLGVNNRPEWMKPFNHPTHAVMDNSGNIYVSDGYGNFCVHKFDTNLSLVATMGEAGANEGQFSTPHALAISPNNEVYVADRENNRVQVFDSNLKYIKQISPMPPPMAISFNANGNLITSDQTATLVLFDNSSSVIGRCRVQGVYGHGLSCSSDGSIYIAEMIPSCLTRLTPVR